MTASDGCWRSSWRLLEGKSVTFSCHLLAAAVVPAGIGHHGTLTWWVWAPNLNARTSAKLRFNKVKHLNVCEERQNKKLNWATFVWWSLFLLLILKSVNLNTIIRSLFSCPNRTAVKNTCRTVKQISLEQQNPIWNSSEHTYNEHKLNLRLSIATVSTCTALHQPK